MANVQPAVQPVRRDTQVWFRLMLVAFLANGLGPFGLKVLTEKGFAAYQSQYLFYWYLGGFIFALMALLLSRSGVNRVEVLLGAIMGCCSFAGQYFTARALSSGVPGHIAFPLTTGGSLFLVAAAGLLLFKERIGLHGFFGIVLGIASLVMLSIA